MTTEIDYFQTAADNLGGIEGVHLRCSKGRWTADGVTIPDGRRVVMIMPSLATGAILWVDGKPAERRVGRIIDGFVQKPTLPDESWNPYCQCNVVFIDDDRRGAPGTFTSSSWGGYFAISKLLRPYSQFRKYPICALSTRDRGDENRNIDPVFNITGWAPPSDFPGYEINATPQLSYETRRDPPPASAELMDDNIPF